uniref:Myb-like protein V n=1 Tax=Nicotiana tabacum TaxID=4097 RepID=A0A1S4CT87_TOBAC|nr:PREDICTED: myb-like protein V [Nicotiana tabacum]
MKPKSKKNVKPSSEPAPTPAPSPSISSTVSIPSSLVLDALTVPNYTGPSLLIPTTHAYVFASKNTSKSTKIKTTLRKSIKSDKVLLDAAAKVDIVVNEACGSGGINVNYNKSDVVPLDNVPPKRDKSQVEEPTDEDDNEGEEAGGIVASHEEHQTQDMANEEKKSENEGDSSKEKESEIEDKIDEQVDDSGEEEKNSEEEGDSESESEDQEKESESEGEDEESEEENDNTSGESEGSMTIGNTVIAPSEEASGEKRTEETGPLLTIFTGDEEVSSDEDKLPLYAVGKKTRKTPVKATKPVIPARKEMTPPARTHLTRSKRKFVDE